ncbi:MAG: carbon-nitrogen hydrolase family protein, partial [Pyrinomonadaceae bacterium]
FARLRQNSIVVPGRESRMLGSAASDLGVVLVIGVNERVDQGAGNGTLYNSLLTLGHDGELLNHHRKLVPTYTERLVWGHGDGDGLKSVGTFAGRMGGLICWEHWMPLARQALHVSGEQIHIAVWPTVHEMHQIACRHYAFEARCFVLAAGLLMKSGDMPQQMPITSELSEKPDQFILRGGSAIIGPDGGYLVEPVFDKEIIITSELDFTAIDKERMTLDVSGHYYRPDIFEMSVKQNSRSG